MPQRWRRRVKSHGLQRRERSLVLKAFSWWSEEQTQLRLIRILFAVTFAGSLAGTAYATVQGTLPTWAITLYVPFLAQLVFGTFMYAIRHSTEADVRRYFYELRRSHVRQWQLERHLAVEFARTAACLAAGVDPTVPLSRHRHQSWETMAASTLSPPWPKLDPSAHLAGLVQKAVLARRDQAQTSGGEMPKTSAIKIDVIAYSAETLVERFGDIVRGLIEVLDDGRVTVLPPLKFRILVRDTRDDDSWLLPVMNSDRGDIRYTDELRTRFRNLQQTAFPSLLTDLSTLPIPSGGLQLDARGYQLEPLMKGVLVDGAGVIGLYAVDQVRNEHGEGLDYSGHNVQFVKCDPNGNPFEIHAVELLSYWFENLWEEHSRSLRFSATPQRAPSF